MEQLCINKEDRQKIYRRIYFTACLTSGITVAAASIFSHVSWLQESFYAVDSTADKPVLTPFGEIMFISPIYLMSLYFFLTRGAENKHFDKLLPVLTVWLAIPLQVVYYIIGLKMGLSLTLGAWLLMSISYVAGLHCNRKIIRYRQVFIFILLLFVTIYSLSFFVGALKSIISLCYPFLFILFSIITIIEARRMKCILENGIAPEHFNNFFLATTTNLFINFFGMITLFDFGIVLYKLIVNDRKNHP